MALAAHGAKLIFYIAGVDVLAGDQLGDFALSARGVLDRDRRVAAAATKLGAPLVVTLAGGYSPGAWQCTANFVRWLLTGIDRVDRSPGEKLLHRYVEVARHFDPWELQSEGDDVRFTESDVLPDLGRRPRRLLLDYYSAHGLELALERFGLLAKIHERGFTDLRVKVNPGDPASQVVRLEGSPVGSPDPSLVLLAEVVLSRRVLAAPPPLGGDASPLSVLCVEWLLLQDPTRPFSPTRPRLPGQEHPGLGLAHEVHLLLILVAKRLRLEGLLHRPAHYHNAVVAGREYHFVDPEVEGRFRALRRLLSNVTLAAATHLVDRGAVRLGDGTPFSWEPADLLLPASDRLVEYFASPYYVERSLGVAEQLLADGLRVQSG